MTVSWNEACQLLDQAALILNSEEHHPLKDNYHAGIDLGTADIVLVVLDENGHPVASFLEWAEVVRDGVVYDFIGAVDIVQRLIDKAQKRLGVEISCSSTSFPPGTSQRLSTNILERAGLEVSLVHDEPTCVANMFHLDKTAVVDLGGGTTGIAVIQDGKVVYSGDEPSGGRHITLSIAGHFNIPLEEAEKRKQNAELHNILNIARPTLQRMADIVAKHITGMGVEQIILTGGTCCLHGVDKVFQQELGLPVKLPSQPLLMTPLAIAFLNISHDHR